MTPNNYPHPLQIATSFLLLASLAVLTSCSRREASSSRPLAAPEETTIARDPASEALYSDWLGRLREEPDPRTVIGPLIANARRTAGGDAGDILDCPQPPELVGLTNDRFYFLSEILPEGIEIGSPACGEALACFLNQIVAHQIDPQNNPPSSFSNATLVVDRNCVVDQTLILPDRFVIAGVGMEGEGALSFDLPDGEVAVRFAHSDGAPERFVTIRDLKIGNASGCCNHVGIDVSNSSFVYLERVRLFDFAFGVIGGTAFSVFVDQSAVHNNAFNIVMDEDATSWRVRDSVISRGLLGVVMAPTARGNLISGGRLESNQIAAILVDGYHNVIENSWFEGNATFAFGDFGVRVLDSATHTQVWGSLFSTEEIQDLGEDSDLCFNVADAGLVVNNCNL